MRPVKFTHAAFATLTSVQRAAFRATLQKKPTVFNEKYFDAVEKRRGENSKALQTLFFLQIPTFIYLVLVLAGNDVNLSLLGITAGKNLREAFVVVSAFLGIWMTWITAEKNTLDNIIYARNEQLAKGDRDTAELLHAGFGLAPIVTSKPDKWNTGLPHLIAIGILALAVLLLIAATVGIVFTVHVMTILEVYRHPNFSALATAFVIGFVLLIDAISLSWFVFSSGMLPYGSDERMQRLLRLKDSNPKRYDEVITAMVHKHRQKPWLLRRWTRPKIPKEL